jgi:hypothetical protein
MTISSLFELRTKNIKTAYRTNIERRLCVYWTYLKFMELNLGLDCKQTARGDIDLKQGMYINKDIAGLCNTHKLGYQKANL